MVGWRRPYVDSILSMALPAHWKGLNMDQYGGSTDPDEHIDIYVTQMSLYIVDKAILCKEFPTSLNEQL